jgi:hypothetical protein
MPESASSGVRRNSVHARLRTASGEETGEVPGLWSVASAIGTPFFLNRSMGGSFVSLRK